MDKKLPKVFVNKIDKQLKNNDSVFYGSKERKEEIRKEKPFSLNQKINKIFGSSTYVYKADVLITLKDKKIEKKIVGRNKKELITFDGEIINISDILDIETK